MGRIFCMLLLLALAALAARMLRELAQALEALASVRRFLAAKARLRGRAVRGHGQIAKRYVSFSDDLPNAARDARVSYAELMTHPYLPEWLIVAAEWIRRRP